MKRTVPLIVLFAVAGCGGSNEVTEPGPTVEERAAITVLPDFLEALMIRNAPAEACELATPVAQRRLVHYFEKAMRLRDSFFLFRLPLEGCHEALGLYAEVANSELATTGERKELAEVFAGMREGEVPGGGSLTASVEGPRATLSMAVEDRNLKLPLERVEGRWRLTGMGAALVFFGTGLSPVPAPG